MSLIHAIANTAVDTFQAEYPCITLPEAVRSAVKEYDSSKLGGEFEDQVLRAAAEMNTGSLWGIDD